MPERIPLQVGRGGCGRGIGRSTPVAAVRGGVGQACRSPLQHNRNNMAPFHDDRMPLWYDRLAFLWRGLCLGAVAGFLLAMALGGDNAVTLIYLPIVVIASLVLASLPSILKPILERRSRIRE